MNIEKGDHFVVTRGFEYHKMPVFSIFNPPDPTESWKQNKKDEEPQYDRSYNGMVFLADEVCESVIAATCVWAMGYKEEKIGEKYSLHTNELEVWPVTKKYIEALKNK